jgi:hypothetical protein
MATDLVINFAAEHDLGSDPEGLAASLSAESAESAESVRSASPLWEIAELVSPNDGLAARPNTMMLSPAEALALELVPRSGPCECPGRLASHDHDPAGEHGCRWAPPPTAAGACPGVMVAHRHGIAGCAAARAVPPRGMRARRAVMRKWPRSAPATAFGVVLATAVGAVRRAEAAAPVAALGGRQAARHAHAAVLAARWALVALALTARVETRVHLSADATAAAHAANALAAAARAFVADSAASRRSGARRAAHAFYVAAQLARRAAVPAHAAAHLDATLADGAAELAGGCYVAACESELDV